ncbi:MAG: hypothetical protein LBK53_09915 [Heliobacteriaceae bacterium]|jgi:hypothetical protein|nr:hypothetical protein [Heliobacteriaceae bacterium]
MLNIQEEIKVLLLRRGLSMTKMIAQMNKTGHNPATVGGLSKSLTTKSVKFDRVQEILDFLGYELEIKKKCRQPGE